MFCQKCGQELDVNNICTNPSCPSNSSQSFENNQSYDSQNYSQPINNNNNNNNNQYSYNYNDSDYYGVTPNEMMDFIGDKKTEYYMEKWTRYQENNKFTSWNWPAFFFGFIWFAYRKMYAYAGILFGIGVANNLIFEVIFDSTGLKFLVSLVVMIACGLVANQLYIKHCIKKITTIKTSLPNISDDSLSRRLRSNGGINWIPVIVILVIYFILFIIVLIGVVALFGAAGSLDSIMYY